jgi:hypothetical protein
VITPRMGATIPSPLEALRKCPTKTKQLVQQHGNTVLLARGVNVTDKVHSTPTEQQIPPSKVGWFRWPRLLRRNPWERRKRPFVPGLEQKIQPAALIRELGDFGHPGLGKLPTRQAPHLGLVSVFGSGIDFLKPEPLEPQRCGTILSEHGRLAAAENQNAEVRLSLFEVARLDLGVAEIGELDDGRMIGLVEASRAVEESEVESVPGVAWRETNLKKERHRTVTACAGR